MVWVMVPKYQYKLDPEIHDKQMWKEQKPINGVYQDNKNHK